MPTEGPENPAQDQRRRPDAAAGGGGANASKTPLAGAKGLNRGPFGWLVLIAMVAMVVLLFQTLGQPVKEVTWQQFVSYYNERALSEITLTDTAVNARKSAGGADAAVEAIRFNVPAGARDVVYKDLSALTGGTFKTTSGPPLWLQIVFSPLIMTIIVFAVLWLIISRGLRSAGGPGGMLGSFGKSRHKVMMKESTGITFKDVAGVEDAKQEVQEIVEFLKHPKKFMKLGGRIPRGVLLTGDPGCGKTLLAKAIAGEADVPFFSISGSDFVEMFVGVGASRVRDLFKQAKESSPCIIFLDEIDAVGRRRGGGFTTGGHDEREQTLNAILVEMDGFDTSDQIIVIAATNRPDVLDPALTRPGRFDRQVVVSLPDVKGRYEILKVHARKVKMGPDVELEKIARGTPMFSGAELAAIINEAAIQATMADKDFVEQEDLEEGRDKIRYGRSRKSRVIEEKERVATAYHEAGHAVLQSLLPDVDPLHKVTIIPRGQALGATFSLPERDRYGFGLRWLRSTMRMVCGGRLAEQRKTGDVSSGASQDIAQLTSLARHMVLEWGMSERLGFVRYSGMDSRESFMPEREYSDETARIIDEEIRRMADEAYRDAERMINEHWEKVEAVAQALLKYETLTSEEVGRLMRGEPLGKPTVSDLLHAEKEKTRRPATPPNAGGRPQDEGPAPGLIPSPA